MIQFIEEAGKWRARYDFGHNSYYKYLLREIKAKKKEVKAFQDSGEKVPKNLVNEIESLEYDLLDLKGQYTFPIKTRRSFNSRHKWQAEQAEELFKKAYEYEAKGMSLPRKLHREINGIQEAPAREDFLEELGYQFASVAGFHEQVLVNFDYHLYLDQSDANTDWICQFEISESEVREKAKSFCSIQDNLTLKGKKYLFTGSFVSYTVCEGYIKALSKLAEIEKVDGIITSGPWIKYIFLHKTARSQVILKCVQDICKKHKVYAIRSNKESAELIPQLKELGITFVNGIEDEKNLFLPYQFTRISSKDQLQNYRDYFKDKNLFVPTTYVAFEPRLVVDHVRYTVGSGTANYNTPSARIWANSYDSQLFKSEKYDRIGGHILEFDNNSEVYPRAFYYNHELEGIFSSGKVITAKGSKKGKMYVIVSDGHFMGVHGAGYNALKDFIKENLDDIAGLIFNGDIFDNAVLCHWNDGNFAKQMDIEKKYGGFLQEVNKTKTMIKDLVALATSNGKRKIELLYKKGNHEVSSFKKLEGKSITHFLSPMLNLDNLLELTAQGFKIIPSDKAYYIGSVPVIHGHEMQRQGARKNFGDKLTMGHSHRGIIDTFGVILPTLEDQKHVDYFTFKGTEVNEEGRAWVVGWGVITNYNGVTEKTELCLVHKNKYHNFKKLSQIDSKVNLVLPKELTLKYALE